SLDRNNELELRLYHNHFQARNFVPLGPFYTQLGLDAATAAFLTAVTPTPQPVINLVSAMTGLGSSDALALIGAVNLEVSSCFGNMKSERYDAELKHIFTLTPPLRGAWGVGSRHESFSAAHPYGFNADA